MFDLVTSTNELKRLFISIGSASSNEVSLYLREVWEKSLNPALNALEFKQLMGEILNDIFSFQYTNSISIKRWLISYLSQICKRDSTFLIQTTAMLNSMFEASISKVYEGDLEFNALIADIVCHSTSIIFDRSYKVLISTSFSNPTTQQLWHQLATLKKYITSLCNTVFTPNFHINLRLQLFKFMEQMVLISTPIINDNDDTQSHTNLFNVSQTAQHPLPISTDDMIGEGKVFFEIILTSLKDQLESTLTYLSNVNNNNPDVVLIKPTFTTQLVLINSIGNLCRKRPHALLDISIGTLYQAARAIASYSITNAHVRSVRNTIRHNFFTILRTGRWNDWLQPVFEVLQLLDSREYAEQIVSRVKPIPTKILPLYPRSFNPFKRGRTNDQSLYTNNLPVPKHPKPDELTLNVPPTQSPIPVNFTGDDIILSIIFETLDKMTVQPNHIRFPQTNEPPSVFQNAISQLLPFQTTLHTYLLQSQMQAANIPQPVGGFPNQPQAPITSRRDPRLSKEAAAANVGPVIVAPVQKTFSLPPPTPENLLMMSDKAIQRIVKLETGVKRSGKNNLRISLLSRLISLKDIQSPLYCELIQHIINDFSSRHSIAVVWLYEEYYKGLCRFKEKYENSIKHEDTEANGETNGTSENQMDIEPKKEYTWHDNVIKFLDDELKAQKNSFTITSVPKEIHPKEEISPKEEEITITEDNIIVKNENIETNEVSENNNNNIDENFSSIIVKEEKSDEKENYFCNNNNIEHETNADNQVDPITGSPILINFSDEYLYRYKYLLSTFQVGISKKFLAGDINDQLFRSFFLQIPYFPNSFFDWLSEYCEDHFDNNRIRLGLYSLYDLITQRTPFRENSTSLLLKYTVHPKPNVREEAIKIITEKLYQFSPITNTILNFATEMIESLKETKTVKNAPTGESAEVNETEEKKEEEISEDTKPVLQNYESTDEEVRTKLQLYISLSTVDNSLLMSLVTLYRDYIPTIKGIIRQMAIPLIKSLGQHSPVIFEILENFPIGSESFVFHLISALVEESPPTSRLVDTIKRVFYQKLNRRDPRFLIPILSEIDKEEIISLLPQIITMSTTHVKMAIESMLKQSTLLNHSSTITPAELLFHLHLVEDPKNENLQLRKSSAIATQICFENLVYNESVLGIVLQQLIDRPQTPKLFLRTVIESFKKFPKLTEYILNLLSKLITKQVWTDEALWKGFIIFCKISKPKSFPLLLQLAEKPFTDAIKNEPDLREPLLAFCQRDTKLVKAYHLNALQAPANQ